MNKGFLGLCPHLSVMVSSPPRAAVLKSECPSAALSWSSVRMYQRSLEARRSTRPREQEREADSHETPVAKRKKTTSALGETDTHATQKPCGYG